MLPPTGNVLQRKCVWAEAAEPAPTWDSRGKDAQLPSVGRLKDPQTLLMATAIYCPLLPPMKRRGGGRRGWVGGGAGEGSTLRKPDTGDMGRGTQAPQTTQLGVSLPWEERPASRLGRSPGQHTGCWGPASLSSPTRAPAVHPCPPR